MRARISALQARTFNLFGSVWRAIFLHHLVLVMVSLGLLLVNGCAPAPKRPAVIPRGDYAYAKRYLSWLIENEMKKHHVTGLSVALVDDQTLVFAEGFGFADKAGGVQAGPETVYPIGSTSKLFTATAAMQLAEQGRINLDEPLQTFLPDFSVKDRFPDAGPITPRTLLTHHSGLPSQWFKGIWSRSPVPFTELVTEIRGEYLCHPPNYVFSYSGVGMTLLGHMVEEVSGRDFTSYMDEFVLRPTGMTHSSFELRPDMKPLLSKGYRDGKAYEQFAWRTLPSAGMYSNVLDLSRFMMMVFDKGKAGGQGILKAETLKDMLEPQNQGVPLDLDHQTGLGWFLCWSPLFGQQEMDPDLAVAQHAGGHQDFRSLLVILPEYKLGVVVLANSASSDPVVQKVTLEALALALEAKTGISAHKPGRLSPRVPLSQKDREELTGTYVTFMGLLPIYEKRGRLFTRLMGKPLQLVSRDDGTFTLRYLLFGIIPIQPEALKRVQFSFVDVGDHKVLALLCNGKRVPLGEKIRPYPIPDAWLRRVGEYEILNPDESGSIEKIHLRTKDGFLLFDIFLDGTEWATGEFILPVLPISDTEAMIYTSGGGLPHIEGTVHVYTADGEERIRHSGYEFRKIKE